MKRLTIASEACHVNQVHDRLLPQVAAAGYNADAQCAIRLSLDEALANAICHGNHQDAHKQITIEYEVSPESVKICVHDQGGGFNPHVVPDPTLDENLQKPHGRGIMLMRAYMSKVFFSQSGNCVTLIKNRNCRKPQK